MGVGAWIRRVWEHLLSFGTYPEEPEPQRGRRRIMVGVFVVSIPILLLLGLAGLASEEPWLAAVDLLTGVYLVAALAALRTKPEWFAGILHVVFFLVMIDSLTQSVLTGGLEASAMDGMFGLLAVLGALIALSIRAAVGWFIGFVAMVVAAAVIPVWVEPLYTVEVEAAEIAFNSIAFSALLFATMAYFVRQRNRFQEQSDDLLHNILPEEVAVRLKAENAMIADEFAEASVLFADVVDFTPLSAGMAPGALVGLLNEVFSTFDQFVDTLGLEKIKTVGDEYMVAAGVPVAMTDHADRAAELALHIRDYVAANEFGGHKIGLRIGINSGPVVAGIIGTTKFAYDLWGDTVNTASRMESEGMAGSIRVSAATQRLLEDRFVLEPRGVVPVKGKGQMNTFILVSRRNDQAPGVAGS